MWAVERIINGTKFYYNRYNAKENMWDSKISHETTSEDEDWCGWIAERFGGKVVKLDSND